MKNKVTCGLLENMIEWEHHKTKEESRVTEKTRNDCQDAKKVGILGILGNIFLFTIKIIVALISKSQAMLADSVNSGTDILTSVMTYIGGVISSAAPDDDHNYGHEKAEYVSSLIISLVMGYLAIQTLVGGISSLIHQNSFILSSELIIVCVVTILTKFLMYLYVKKVAKKNNDILIMASGEDHRNDILITLSVLIGILAAIYRIYWLDGIVAIGIAIRIFYSAITFFVQSYSVLMDRAMDEKGIEKIKEIIQKYEKIDHIDKITSKATGKAFVVIIKVSVDGNMTVNESHQIAGRLKADVMQLPEVYDVVVHINPL